MGMDALFRKPDGEEFSVDFVEPNLNFLAHAQAVECDLGSECGGHGVCGMDRIRITSTDGSVPKLSPLTEEELRHLTDRERSDGWRLACQVFPESRTGSFVIEVLSARSCRR